MLGIQKQPSSTWAQKMGIFPKVGAQLLESCLPTHIIQLFLSILAQPFLQGAENEWTGASTTCGMHPHSSFNQCCKKISLVSVPTSAIKWTGLLPPQIYQYNLVELQFSQKACGLQGSLFLRPEIQKEPDYSWKERAENIRKRLQAIS